jgi:PAT family beta-lactamase induction signal transducer AmpG
MVTSAANILFANLGLPNERAAAYSSVTGFAYSLNFLWAPLLELYRTKKFFVVATQVALVPVFFGVALALRLPAPVAPIVALLLVAAMAGATQDVATNGVYVTTLDAREQAAFTGVGTMTWSLGPILASSFLVILVGRLAGEGANAALRPGPGAYAHAWLVVFGAVAALLIGVSAYHAAFLPAGAPAATSARSVGDVARTFGKVFVSFMQKRDVAKLMAFAFFYRVGIGLLDKVASLFWLDSREHGGLGLDNGGVGVLNGLATAAFIGGSMAGGWFVARRGLRQSLMTLCLCLNVPNVTFLYLAWARPHSMTVIALVFVIEKLGWGFGSVGHMIYMMQQIAPGPYKTAHYSFATGLGLSLSMTLMGLVSGYVEAAVGYQLFAVVVLLAAIPSIFFTWIAPFHHADEAPAR